MMRLYMVSIVKTAFIKTALMLSAGLFMCGCEDGDNLSDAASLRQYALDCLSKGKTYVSEEGFDNAISYYEGERDTVAVLEMCQLAAIRMRWLNQQDSAAAYLKKALGYATRHTSPNASDLYIELANLYAHPLLPKDYTKTIEYSKCAIGLEDDIEKKGRALHDIGVSYAFLERSDSSKIYLERALALTTPDNPDYTQFALNYANHPAADPKKAIKYLDGIKGEVLGKYITLGFIYFNQHQPDSAKVYLERSQKLFDKSPDSYSINTYNNLRLLKGYVDYSRYGRAFPDEGTERNDSINQRLLLNQKIEIERRERNARLQMRLLESEANRQRVWIGCLIGLLVIFTGSVGIYFYNKRRYLKIRRELDALRLAQIEQEALSASRPYSDSSANVEDTSASFDIIRRRAEACVALFRETGLIEIIQKGEVAYSADGSYLAIKDRKMVQQSLLECFSDFILDLKMDCGKLSMDDIITSLLSLICFSNAAIASCIGATDGAVRTRKSRLRGKLSKEMTELLNM